MINAVSKSQSFTAKVVIKNEEKLNNSEIRTDFINYCLQLNWMAGKMPEKDTVEVDVFGSKEKPVVQIKYIAVGKSGFTVESESETLTTDRFKQSMTALSNDVYSLMEKFKEFRKLYINE